VLWPLGTITGLASSLAVPYLMVTRLQAAPDAAFGGWLMPVVPPMVSAVTGELLVSHLPTGQLRLTMLLACYAMFGLSLIAAEKTLNPCSRVCRDLRQAPAWPCARSCLTTSRRPVARLASR
jgi:hypothetical protein